MSILTREQVEKHVEWLQIMSRLTFQEYHQYLRALLDTDTALLQQLAESTVRPQEALAMYDQLTSELATARQEVWEQAATIAENHFPDYDLGPDAHHAGIMIATLLRDQAKKETR